MIGRVLASQVNYGSSASQLLKEARQGEAKPATPVSRVVAGIAPSVLKDMARITGVSEGTLSSNSDIFSVTGNEVTPLFSGGQDTFTLVWGTEGTNITFTASGTQPNATKSVAVMYGTDATPAQKATAQALGLRYLNMHITDHQTSPGNWDKPLFDFSA